MQRPAQRRRRLRASRTVQTAAARPMMATPPNSRSILGLLLELKLWLLVLAGWVLVGWQAILMDWLPLDWMLLTPTVVMLLPLLLYSLSGWPMEQAWVIMIAVWPQWALNLLLSEEKSLEEYVRANAVIQEHKLSAENEDEDGDAILLCTDIGINLWSGFIEVILKAYRCNKSWGGKFSLENLRMSGHRCRISLDPTYPASFSNLLLDFSKLAQLLFNYFKVEKKHEAYVRLLYRSMTRPGASPTSSEDAQEKHIKFIRNHPALRSLRQRRLFLVEVMKSYKAMRRADKERFARTLEKVNIGGDWRLIAQKNASFCRVLFYRKKKQVFVYQKSPEELFRFLRNFFEHGAEADDHGRQIIGKLDDMDCLDMELMPNFVVQLVHQMIINSNMSGLLAYPWKHYGLI